MWKSLGTEFVSRRCFGVFADGWFKQWNARTPSGISGNQGGLLFSFLFSLFFFPSLFSLPSVVSLPISRLFPSKLSEGRVINAVSLFLINVAPSPFSGWRDGDVGFNTNMALSWIRVLRNVSGLFWSRPTRWRAMLALKRKIFHVESF